MGVFNTTDGNVVDYDYIVAFIAKLSARFKIREIAYDRYGAEKSDATLKNWVRKMASRCFLSGRVSYPCRRQAKISSSL
jgi:phage terminase large subunit-like protein